MSLVTQISGPSPDDLWRMATLPVAVAVDLAIGDVPGRTYALGGLRWLIEALEGVIRRAVARLGGGRGGELFCGVSLGLLVIGTVAGGTWMAVDAANAAGGPAILVVQAGLIAAGLVIRATGDPILDAIEAPDRLTAAASLTRAGGMSPPWLGRVGPIPVGLAATAELLPGRIVAPLFWLALGGPASLWGFIAARSLREVMLARDDRLDLTGRILVGLADAAEAIPAALTAGLIPAAAAIVRADAATSAREAIRQAWLDPRRPSSLPTAALAGALGLRIPVGRVFATGPESPDRWLGPLGPPPDSSSVVRAVRIAQVVTLLAASLVALARLIA